MTQATKDLDVRILQELTSPGSLQWNFRESYSEIGKRLGADPETVRVTLNRSVKSGLIQKWRLVPNPELFGYKMAGIQLSVADLEKKPAIISELQTVDGVFLILDFHGTGVKLQFYFENEVALRRQIQLIKSICGQEDEVASWTWNLPHCKMRIGAMDWRIIRSMLHDPRKDSVQVAEEIGLSKRTVNRRLKAMTEANVGILFPVRNARNRKGTLCSYLIFASDQGRDGAYDILKSLDVRVDFRSQLSKDKVGLIIEADNPSEAKEFYQRLKKVDGVSRVVMDLIDDYIFVDRWLDQMVSRARETLIR